MCSFSSSYVRNTFFQVVPFMSCISLFIMGCSSFLNMLCALHMVKHVCQELECLSKPFNLLILCCCFLVAEHMKSTCICPSEYLKNISLCNSISYPKLCICEVDYEMRLSYVWKFSYGKVLCVFRRSLWFAIDSQNLFFLMLASTSNFHNNSVAKYTN